MGWASEVQALLERAAADDIVPGAAAAAAQRDGTTELAWAGSLRVDGEAPVGPDPASEPRRGRRRSETSSPIPLVTATRSPTATCCATTR
jgi:hypothetical protein